MQCTPGWCVELITVIASSVLLARALTHVRDIGPKIPSVLIFSLWCTNGVEPNVLKRTFAPFPKIHPPNTSYP